MAEVPYSSRVGCPVTVISQAGTATLMLDAAVSEVSTIKFRLGRWISDAGMPYGTPSAAWLFCAQISTAFGRRIFQSASN